MTNERALDDLEWARLERAVLDRCRGPLRENGSVPLATTFEGAETALAETREAMELDAAGSPLIVDGVSDVSQTIARLSRMGSLDGPGLVQIKRTLSAARALRQFLARHKAFCPRLHAACALDPTLDAILDELGRHLDEDGTLHDHASAELRRLRTETANLRARLHARLEEILVRRADILQDSFHTVREGRYVVPVRRDAHERFEGIVHGASSSGATLFVEPQELVAQGNRLKVAQAEQEREEARILAELSDRVRDVLPALEAAVDALDLADLRQAAARFGVELKGRVLSLDREPVLDLKAAKHPLLLLEGGTVVGNDIVAVAGRALILSGPNAGGKTVALTTLGLAALMMRAGLPIPCADGSRAGFFHEVLTDVGDSQSLVKNLSTFSAHMKNVASIISRSKRGSLVLLDELAGGTDPHEGAALAAAIVDALCASGAATAVTTHYESLKAMGVTDARTRNASVGFDVQTMRPSFELTLDVPGSSSALSVAARFGIPTAVIERAERALPEESRTFEALVAELSEARAEHQRRAAALEEERRVHRKAREDLERELEKLRRREEKQLSEEGARLTKQMRDARAELRAARREIRRATTEAAAEATRKKLDAIEKSTAAIAAERPPPAAPAGDSEAMGAPASLTVGDRVYVERLRAEAQIIEGPTRGEVRVAAGALKLWVPVAECRAPRPDVPAPRRAAPRRGRSPEPADETVDVRGMRAEDAIGCVESFLDRAYGASLGQVTIVHGIGEGALMHAVREHLAKHSAYARSHRPGTREEGGDRVTVVELR
jgi:DNA mismatch repair protein MutS2